VWSGARRRGTGEASHVEDGKESRPYRSGHGVANRRSGSRVERVS